MKRTIRNKMAKRNFDELISVLTENEILTTEALSCVRGGDGEGDGGGDIIIIPPKQQ